MTVQIPSSTDVRARQGKAWASDALSRDFPEMATVAGDASFRRYFRLRDGDRSWILMDAPPDREDSKPFIEIARRLHKAGLRAPAIIDADMEQGFVLLEDFGDTLLKQVLHTNNADEWFEALFEVLEQLTRVDATGLPAYDRNRLLEELELFPAWYLERHKGLTLACEQWDLWEDLCTRLIQAALQQPKVFVHRDFHSCNLLQLDARGIGVIDFQDGVRGPLTYDFASLAWDRYIAWPRQRLENWMEVFRLQVAPDCDPDQWVRWCDWMGLQRNLKIVGIFARLHYRDGKQGYLEMIPQFWGYIQDVLSRYPEFAGFSGLLEDLKCAP